MYYFFFIFSVCVNLSVDTIAPTIMNCPVAGSVGAVIELGMPNTMVAWPEPTAADRSGTSVAQRSHAPGSSFPVGDTTVTYIFQDSAGNTAPCQFTVSVTTGRLLTHLQNFYRFLYLFFFFSELN